VYRGVGEKVNALPNSCVRGLVSVRAAASVLVLTLGSAACARSDREVPNGAALGTVGTDDAPAADAAVPPSNPVEAEPEATVREVRLADRRVRVELSPAVSMHHDSANDIVTFELAWKQTVQLRVKAGPASESIAPTTSKARVLDEGQTETGVRYSIQTFEVRIGHSNGGRHVHRYEQVARVYATLPIDEHQHVECTGFLEHRVDDADDEGVRSLSRVCLSMALDSADVEETPRETAVADPTKGTPEVTVVGTLVGLPQEFPPHCGRAYFSIFAEYEVVRVVEGTLSGSRFFVVHGCPEMLRARLQSLEVGDVHRLELSTDPRLRGGMSLPPPPRPPFYWPRRVQKE
jgi:hypothetical protein